MSGYYPLPVGECRCGACTPDEQTPDEETAGSDEGVVEGYGISVEEETTDGTATD